MSTWPTDGTTDAGTLESAEAETSALFEQHRGRVYAFCLGRLGDREEAADAVQDTYAKAWIALRAGCDVTHPLAWLLTIAGNVCTSRFRARCARPVETELSDETEATITYLPGAELAGLPTALRSLPDGQRRAFVLRELRGCSYEEIGRDLGVSEPSVAALLHRARRAIAASLSGAGRRVLVTLPLPGVIRSAFEGGMASTTVAATAAGTVLLVAPQLGTAPMHGNIPPSASARTQVITAAASRPSTASVLVVARSTSDSGHASKSPASLQAHVSFLPPGAAPAAVPAGDGATVIAVDEIGSLAPTAPPDAGRTDAPSDDAQAQPGTPDPQPTPGETRAVQVATAPAPAPVVSSLELTSAPEAATVKSNGPPAEPGSQGQGNGPPAEPGSQGQGNGPPAEPGSQGQGNGPPAEPGSQGQGNGPPAEPGSQGQGNGPPAEPGSQGQGNGPPHEPGSRSADNPGNGRVGQGNQGTKE